MQQIALFNHELNYTPYRYRHRSNTNPKKNSNNSHSNSYSRGKKQKYNPERIHSEQNIPSLEFISRSKMNNQKKNRFQQQQDRFQQGDQQQESQKIEESHINDSQLQINQAQQSQQNLKENDQQYIHESEDNPPIQLIQKQHAQSSVQARQKLVYEENNQQNQRVEVSSPQKMSSIFNESDLREFKENILQHIRHAESQQKLQIEEQQSNQKQETPIISQPSQVQINLQQQRIVLDARYQRIRAINQQYEQNQEFNRNLKKRETVKKVKKIKAQQMNNKFKTISNDYHQKLSKFNDNVVKPSIQITKNNLQCERNSSIAEQMLSHTINGQIILSQPHKQAVSWIRYAQRYKQRGQKTQNTSIRTTNTSYGKQRQEKASLPEILTFDKYKQKMKAKGPSIDKKNTESKPNSLKKYQLYAQQQIPIANFSFKTQPKQLNFIQFPKESESPITGSDLLSQFTKFDTSKVIVEIREAKSKGKQQVNKQISNSSTIISYSAKPPFASGYKNKHLQAGQTYSINMKKKKQKQNSKAPQQYINSPINPINGYLDRIQQQTYSMQDQQSLKEPINFPLRQHIQNHTQNTNKQESFHKENAPQNNQNCKIVRQDLIQLQEGIADFLNAQRDMNRSNRAGSRESSHPTSRVYEIHNLQELKSEDGEQLLKMMAVNTNFKQLSSLVIEDRSPQYHDSSLISQQLCEIINSNQSELSASPTPQNVSLSSSLHYPFEEDEKGAYQNEKSEMDASGTLPQGSALIQINEDSRIFFQKLGFTTEPLIAPDLQQRPQENLYVEQASKQQNQANQLSRPTSSRKSMQAQAGCSIHEYKSHFHPSAAIRKFKHAKHNSADFQQKSLKSARLIHHSLSTIRRNIPSLESCERIKTRLQRNQTRFRTRLTDS